MVEQRLSQQTLPSSNQPKPSIVDELFDLIASHDLDVMLDRALRMTIRFLSAEAGSILFQIQSPRNIRSGVFRQEALVRIQRWEEAIGKRLQDTTWRISPITSLPVSISKLTRSQLVLVSVPLLQDTSVVGSLSLVLPPGSQLAKNQRDLLTRIAAGLGQIASLIRELELTNRRLKQMSVFYEVGQALVTTFDITELLSEAMVLAANVIDAGAASIMLIDEERQELVFKVSHGSRGQMLRQQRIPLDEGIAGWVARHGRPVIANDARADTRFSHRVDVRTGFLTQSIAAVPLKVKGRIIGVLQVLNKYSGSGFGEEDIQLMSSIAAQAAIAIENARLYQRVRKERDHVIKTQEDARRDLVRNLQDGPGQLLSAISMGLDHLERLSVTANPEVVQNQIGALRNLVHQATRDTHNVLFELRPVILDLQGLVAALEQYVGQLQDSGSFAIHFSKKVGRVNFNTNIVNTIFSIVQEAINNVKRHANAHNVWLSLEVKQNHFVVTVRDDGQGFDVNKIGDEHNKQGLFGILIMRERAALIEAKLQIGSRTEAPHRGTIVRLTLSCPAKDAAQAQA